MGRMRHFKFCHFSILLKIRRLLGHKTPAMTQRYAHHYPESSRDAVEVLDKLVTNQSQRKACLKDARKKFNTLSFGILLAQRRGRSPR